MKIKHLVRLGVFLAVAYDARSVEINFTSPLFENFKTSTNAPLDATYSFSLGSFGAFVPTSANVADWAANFTQLGSVASYVVEDQGFGSTVILSSNEPPFVAGGQAYIWGYNLAKTEMVLLRNPAWEWPLSSGELPVNFNTDDDGTVAVLGFIGAPFVGADPYIQTAAATLKLQQTITFAAPADRFFSTTSFSLSATASSGLAVNFALVSGPATVVGNAVTPTGTGTVTIRASQPGDASYAAAADVERSFAILPSFEFWQQSKFTSGELADPGVSGPNAVYGTDGIPNLVKYALGLEPTQNVVTGLPPLTKDATDWIYTYSRPDNIADVTYTVEFSTTLATWSSVGITHAMVADAGGVQTWEGRYPKAGTPRIIMRLRVTQ